MSLILRPLSLQDLPGFAAYANNSKVSNYMTDAFPHPYTIKDAESFYDRNKDKEPRHVLGIEWNGEIVGAIGIHPQEDIHRMNAEMGYWVAEAFWGKGIASLAVEEMIRYAFNNFDIDRIFARPFGSNLASQRVLEKNGFVLEARFNKNLVKGKRREDELVFGLRRSDWI